MFELQAMDLLGLAFSDTQTAESITLAYKKKIKEVHPDKNHSEEATARTQALNEARDVLLQALPEAFLNEQERVRQEQEDEIKAQHAETQHKKESVPVCPQEATRRSKEKHPDAPPVVTTSGKRLHMPSGINPVVCSYLVEMTDFLKSTYEPASSVSDYVSIEDILKQFEHIRGKELSSLEYNMFKKKCRSVICKLFPASTFIVRKKQRCYAFLKLKDGA